jgi:hypothetical protein
MLALIARAADPGAEQHASTETTQLYTMLEEQKRVTSRKRA